MHILNHVIGEIRLGQEIRKQVYMHCNNLVSGYHETSNLNIFGQRLSELVKCDSAGRILIRQ